MKTCPKCNAQIDDSVAFCPVCGAAMNSENAKQAQNYDHTAEFDAQDISENKVLAMVPYLLGPLGLIIALLAMSQSKYVSFHVKQALKLNVVAFLIPIALLVAAVVNIIPFLGWFVYALVLLAAAVCSVIILVLEIIAFFQVCSGKAVEPAIVRDLKFLK